MYVRYQFQPCNNKFSNRSNQSFPCMKIWKCSSKRVFVQFIRVISILNPFIFCILPFFSQIKISIILFWGVLRKIILPNRSTLNIELLKLPHNNHNNLYCQSSQGSLHIERCIQVISPSPREWKYYTNKVRLVPVC